MSKTIVELIAELKKLRASATQGRWWHMSWETESGVDHGVQTTKYNIAEDCTENDAMYIAAIHNAMPILLQYIRELEDKIADLLIENKRLAHEMHLKRDFIERHKCV